MSGHLHPWRRRNIRATVELSVFGTVVTLAKLNPSSIAPRDLGRSGVTIVDYVRVGRKGRSFLSFGR
jgi:uncharacterized membrane protein